MKRKIIYTLAIILLFAPTLSKAQTALQISGMDCNNMSHDLFAELDAGKAAVVFFFMDNCGSCPPPAMDVQSMVNNILLTYPNKVTGYAMPYNNATNCVQTAAWVTSNSLNFYSPYDSGAVQVAHYGGFGMPTVVLLGGSNHRTMFKTQSFSSSDTTIMRDSILALFAAGPSAVNTIADNFNHIAVFPNPASNKINIALELKENAALLMDIIDITGKQIASVCNLKMVQGPYSTELNTEKFSNGSYILRITSNGKMINRRFDVIH